MEKFKYLGVMVINSNEIHEEIKCLLNIGNVCYYLLENSKKLKVKTNKTIMLSVVLCGYETWSLTLREEHRLRVFENKALRKLSEAKRDGITGKWRNLHNDELHTLYSSPNVILAILNREVEMGRTRSTYAAIQNSI